MQSLREWLLKHDVSIDDRLVLQRSSDGSASIVAHSPIPSRTTVAAIPKTLCLSHRNSSLASDPDLASLDGLSPSVRLAVHVAHELSSGEESRWAIYLQHCPRRAVRIASLWDRKEDAHAIRWLRGTRAEQESVASGEDKSRLISLFDGVVCKLLTGSAAAALSASDFLHAYSLVSSRAFHIDAYHSLALVPFADVFNHSDTPHVHLASDHWVCPVCGTLRECPHDEQGDGTAASKGHDSTSGNDTCDMVTELDVAAGEEVYNTYGRLPNGRLLASYGFILDGNEQDEILLDPKLVVEAAQCQFGSDHDLEPAGTTNEAADLSGQIKISAMSRLTGALARHPLVTWDVDQAKLFVDADGRISIGFFTLAARLILGDRLDLGSSKQSNTPSSPSTPSVTLLELLDVSAAVFEESEAALPTLRQTGDLAECVRQISRVIRQACLAYIGNQEQPQLACDVLLDMADTLSGQTHHGKEELALRYLAGERLLVQRTALQWLFDAET